MTIGSRESALWKIWFRLYQAIGRLTPNVRMEDVTVDWNQNFTLRVDFRGRGVASIAFESLSGKDHERFTERLARKLAGLRDE